MYTAWMIFVIAVLVQFCGFYLGHCHIKIICMVKVRPFVGRVVFIVVFFFQFYVFNILRARHDHNKIAPCGIINLFFLNLNSNNNNIYKHCETFFDFFA